MRRLPPKPTLTDKLVPYTTLCRSGGTRPWSDHCRRHVSCCDPIMAAHRRHGLFDPVGQVEGCLPADQRLREIGRSAQLGRGTAGLCIGKRHERGIRARRSEEHTSELQSLMRITYAVFCLKKKQTYES